MIKKIIAIGMILMIAIMVHGENGIKFEKGLTWEQVKHKARSENKYIFIDCFATWCGPCKKMDQAVYSDPKVGEFMSGKFISIKLQMDSTKNDNDEVKQWYPIVHQFIEEYSIKGYPNYLFFSPDGKLVHQDLGFKDVTNFISLVKLASDPMLQDANVIKSYIDGNKNHQILLKVSTIYKKNGNKGMADSVASEYKRTYLDKLEDKELFTRENIKFVSIDFSLLLLKEGSGGRFFKYFISHTKDVDSIMGKKDFTIHIIRQIVRREELSQKLILNNQIVTAEPNWDSLELNIEKKWGKVLLAKDLIANYKPSFYLYSKNWKKWSQLFDKQLQTTPASKNGHHFKGPFSDETVLNENAWTVFVGCYDKKVIKRAIKWVSLAIKLKDTANGVQAFYDTKANLLYKLGRIKRAIGFEKMAIEMDNHLAIIRGNSIGFYDLDYKEVLRKMKSKQPTWPDRK